MNYFTEPGYEQLTCNFEGGCSFKNPGTAWTRIRQFSGTQYPNHFLAEGGKDRDTEIYGLVLMIARARGLIFQSTSLMIIVPYIRNSIS